MEDDKYFIGFGNESHISSPVTSCRVWVSLFNGPGSQLHTATNRNRKTLDSGPNGTNLRVVVRAIRVHSMLLLVYNIAFCVD